jgi:hypothetical protein
MKGKPSKNPAQGKQQATLSVLFSATEDGVGCSPEMLLGLQQTTSQKT